MQKMKSFVAALLVVLVALAPPKQSQAVQPNLLTVNIVATVDGVPAAGALVNVYNTAGGIAFQGNAGPDGVFQVQYPVGLANVQFTTTAGIFLFGTLYANGAVFTPKQGYVPLTLLP